MAGYTYDPSESIKQSFQQATAGVGNIFAQVIQQQQRDYNLAENAFQNIEALKKDLNIFGQKNVTSKSNDLLKEASTAILSSGKLDYSKLGEIRQKISGIRDLKQGYDIGAKEYERMLQLGIANKDNLVSFEKFYKDLSAKMGDENLVKNPQDLQRALVDTYSSNLDSSKMFVKSFSNANPYEDKLMDIKDPKTGALMRVEGKIPKGYTIDATGKVIPKAPITTVVNGQTVTMDYADQELARLQSTDPDLLGLMRKQAGAAGANMSEKDLVKFYIDNKVVTPVKAVQVKSQADIQREEALAKSATFTAENQGRVLEADLAAKAASIEGSRAQSKYYNAQADMLSGGGPQGGAYSSELYDPVAKKNVKYNAFPLQTETPTAIKLANGKAQGAIVSDVAIGDNGQIYAKVGVSSREGVPEKRIVKDKKYINDYQFHQIQPSAVPAFLRDMKVAAGKYGDKATKTAALANISNIEATYNQLKGSGNTPRVPAAKKTPKPSGKFISAKLLETMYGEGKPYPTKEAAVDAAINTYGHSVEGYNN